MQVLMQQLLTIHQLIGLTIVLHKHGHLSHQTSYASWTQHRGIRVLVRGDRTQPESLTGAA